MSSYSECYWKYRKVGSNNKYQVGTKIMNSNCNTCNYTISSRYMKGTFTKHNILKTFLFTDSLNEPTLNTPAVIGHHTFIPVTLVTLLHSPNFPMEDFSLIFISQEILSLPIERIRRRLMNNPQATRIFLFSTQFWNHSGNVPKRFPIFVKSSYITTFFLT